MIMLSSADGEMASHGRAESQGETARRQRKGRQGCAALCWRITETYKLSHLFVSFKIK